MPILSAPEQTDLARALKLHGLPRHDAGNGRYNRRRREERYPVAQTEAANLLIGAMFSFLPRHEPRICLANRQFHCYVQYGGLTLGVEEQP